ncbi:UPF0061 protein YdiU [hydrothermal vent metagenome]|uniref:UPF0061 protein YdiU n=1 Tax=hydrothermal vent metagenome TaxID=652676 RepID=A0A3B0YKY4_9ZZZZ
MISNKTPKNMLHKADQLPMNNSFASLGTEFFSRVKPFPFNNAPQLVHLNQEAAKLIDLNTNLAHRDILTKVFSGQSMIIDSDPLAMLYAGHQFGGFVPQLGDGRAMLIGETRNAKNEQWEIQLKGSGVTPYSRNGDGRAVLRSTIREYLCSEAMHALNIPTTRALCMVASHDEIYRENIETAAMLTRLAPSHIRFGSFEVFYYRKQFEPLKILADYVIDHHYTEFKNKTDRYILWLEAVIDRTSKLMAQWQSVGFCHGVMNSDNMSILGLTLDYGPYGFLDDFNPDYICNHSDHQGRYAYKQQPQIGLFNLSCFAQAILPLIDPNSEQAEKIATQLLGTYQDRYSRYDLNNMRAKLGLVDTGNISPTDDAAIINNLLIIMASDQVDFTILFRIMCDFDSQQPSNNQAIQDMFVDITAYQYWARQYSERLQQQNEPDQARSIRMKAVNPKYILRNYMAEAAIREAEDNSNFTEIDRLFDLLQHPFDEQTDQEKYARLPPDWASKISVSCSS